ncbi:hypothetical protein PR003_g22634, partial [Phytophthora rubi]
MRAEAQSAAQASATNMASFAARPTTTKPVEMSVPTLDGKDSDSLVFWVREIEIALSAGQIYDARAQVAFALSNLGGRARAWAMARETATPGYFTSWSFMEQELRSTFLLANVAYRHRSSFLRCKQGKRSLQDYVMELHNLEATMAGAPLSEDVKVTVFMGGVRTGPVRTELFRRQAKTFNEAVHIAMLEATACAQHKGTRPMPRPRNRALAGHVPSSSRDGFVHEHRVPRGEQQFAGTSEVLELPMALPPRARELEVGGGEDPQDPSTSPGRGQGSAVGNRVALAHGAVKTQGADAVAARAGSGGSVRIPPTQGVVAGSAHVETGAGVVARANKSGRVGTPTTQGVVAGSAHATKGAGAGARATTSGRAGAPTFKDNKGDKVTSTPKREASSRDADSA